jgi:hypothetical protein
MILRVAMNKLSTQPFAAAESGYAARAQGRFTRNGAINEKESRPSRRCRWANPLARPLAAKLFKRYNGEENKIAVNTWRKSHHGY